MLIFSGRSETDALARYAIGIVVELALAGAALLCLRRERLPIRRTARLRGAEPRVVVLALVAVPGLWMTGISLNLLSRAVFGYTTPVTPAQFPRTGLEAIALAITTIIVAPLCEEVMFRGYVQRAYEQRHPWIGVVIGGLIFSLYHLRFQGLFSLLPVALALGLIAWRTESLVPAIALHAGFNAIATLLLIASSFASARVVSTLTVGLVFVATLALPASYAALWLLCTTTSPTNISSPQTRRSYVWAIPIAVLLAIYGYAAATEVLIHRFPEAVLDDSVDLNVPVQWQTPMRWTYDIVDRLGNAVGEATCTTIPALGIVVLTCDAAHDVVDLVAQVPTWGGRRAGGVLDDASSDTLRQLPFGLSNLTQLLYADATSWHMVATWTSPALTLERLHMELQRGDLPVTELRFPTPGAEDAPIAPNRREDPDDLRSGDPSTLIGYEWAWRLQTLPFRLPYGAPITVIQSDAQGVLHRTDGFVKVQGGEPIWTPSGNHITWKVRLTWDAPNGDPQSQTAWYDAQAPHTLVRLDDGAVSYVLAAVEEAHP